MLTPFSRSYFSIPQLCAAAKLALQVHDLEAESPPSDEAALLQRGIAIASITSSVSALDSAINELLQNAGDEPRSHGLGALGEAKRRQLATRKSAPEKFGSKTLWKYYHAHEVCVGSPMDKTAKPYLMASLAIDLRHRFVHSKPLWQQHNLAGMPTFEDPFTRMPELDGLFAYSKFATAGSPFYPDKVIGYGSARWAFQSVLAFMDGFWTAIGIEAPYKDYRKFFIYERDA